MDSLTDSTESPGQWPLAAEEKWLQDGQLEGHLYVAASAIHGQGVFAREFICAGAYVGTYHGRPTDEDGVYVLWVEDESGRWQGRDGENLLRFLNHSVTPNAEFEGHDLYALEDIQPGEEICFHYGREFELALREED